MFHSYILIFFTIYSRILILYFLI